MLELQLLKSTEVFWLVVQKSRRESAHARTLDGHFELKIMRMRGFSSRFLDNQPENLSKIDQLIRYSDESDWSVSTSFATGKGVAIHYSSWVNLKH